MTITFNVHEFADNVVRQLNDNEYAWIDYEPGDITLYRLLFVFGPGPDEMTLAWPAMGVAATLPPHEVTARYLADNMFNYHTNYAYEAKHGPITALYNAVVTDERFPR